MGLGGLKNSGRGKEISCPACLTGVLWLTLDHASVGPLVSLGSKSILLAPTHCP